MGKLLKHWHKHWWRYALLISAVCFVGVLIAGFAYPALLPLAINLAVAYSIPLVVGLAHMTPVVAIPLLATLGAFVTTSCFLITRAMTGFANYVLHGIKSCILSFKKQPPIPPQEFLQEQDIEMQAVERFDEAAVMGRLPEHFEKAEENNARLLQDLEQVLVKHQGLELDETLLSQIDSLRALSISVEIDFDVVDFNEAVKEYKRCYATNQQLRQGMLGLEQQLNHLQAKFDMSKKLDEDDEDELKDANASFV